MGPVRSARRDAAGAAPPEAGAPAARPASPPFGRPTAAELVEAVREYLEAEVMERSEGGARFEARVARNALGVVERELRLGTGARRRARRATARPGVRRRRRPGRGASARATLDDEWEPVAAALAASARDQLLVANPVLLAALRPA